MLDENSRAGAKNIALFGVGENAWRYRGLAYRGIVEVGRAGIGKVVPVVNENPQPKIEKMVAFPRLSAY